MLCCRRFEHSARGTACVHHPKRVGGRVIPNHIAIGPCPRQSTRWRRLQELLRTFRILNRVLAAELFPMVFEVSERILHRSLRSRRRPKSAPGISGALSHHGDDYSSYRSGNLTRPFGGVTRRWINNLISGALLSVYVFLHARVSPQAVTNRFDNDRRADR